MISSYGILIKERPSNYTIRNRHAMRIDNYLSEKKPNIDWSQRPLSVSLFNIYIKIIYSIIKDYDIFETTNNKHMK
jgi:hypothetical protein